MASEMISKGINGLPHTLAHSLHGYDSSYQSQNWSGAMLYMLDFFEMSCQLVSLVLLGQLKSEVPELKNDPAINKIIGKIDAKRPLSFGDWANDILTPLVSLSLSKMGDNAFVKSISTVISPKKHIIIGRKGEASIVKIRNDYKGHGTILSQDISSANAVINSSKHLNPEMNWMLPFSLSHLSLAALNG